MEGGNKLMPNTTDTKILEMRFDNAQFERNIRQSMRSLNELDKALKMDNAAKGFEKIEKAANKGMDFSKMEKSLSFLEYRFSALGMTAAKVIDRTTSKIGGLFTKLHDMTIGQIKSGGMTRALKLEHANFMLDGILKDAEKVKDIMDNAVSPAVDGTAYGLDAAANAASQFVATGIRDVEKLKIALTGISGVAAMSGSEYEEIARIFTKVAASGRMMGDEVMQLSTRGISAQAELAKYLNKSVAEVQEMQKKGQISFEIFANAMNSAFGEQAKKANDTFTGAMSNLKAALSRIGADFATPYINNMRDIFNALRLTVNDVRKAMQPIVKLFTAGITTFKNFIVEFTKNRDLVLTYTTAIKNIYFIINLLASSLHTIRDGFLQAFPSGMIGILAEASGRLTEFLYRVQISKSTLQGLSDIFGGLFSILKLVGYVIQQITGYSGPLLSGANSLLGLAIRILGVIGKLITKTVDYITTNKKGINILNAIKTVLLLVGVALLEIGKHIYDFIRTVKDMPIVQDIFNGLYNAAINLANFALPLLAKAGGAVVGAFKYLIDLGKSGFFGDIFSALSTRIKGLHDILNAGTNSVSAFTSIFSGGFKKLPWTITAYAKSVDELKTAVGDNGKRGGLIGLILGLGDAFDNFNKAIQGIGTSIFEEAKKFGIARGLIVGTGAALISMFVNISGVARNFKRAFAGIPGVISALKNNLNANIFDVKAKAVILGLAVAIGSLTVSLVALSLVDSGKLRAAAVSLSILIGVMSLAGVLVNRLGGGFDGFKAVAFSFMSFAGAVGILIMGLAALANIDLNFTELMKRVLALAAIMAALGAVVIAITQLSKPFSVMLGGGFMLAFALAIKMLVSSLDVLGKMDVENINKALPALLKMMGMLALIGAACTALSPFAGIGFLGIVGGITAFILALTGLAEILKPEKFIYIHTLLVDIYNAVKGWLVLFAIATLISSIRKAVAQIGQTVTLIRGGLAQIAGTSTAVATIMTGPLTILAQAVKGFATASTIGVLVGGFVAIAYTISKLKEIPNEEFMNGVYKAVTIASGLMIFLGAVMLLQKLILGKKQFLAGLEKIAFSLAALIMSLSLSMKLIAEIAKDNPAGLDTAIQTIGVLMLIVTGFEVVSAILAKDSKAMQMGIRTAFALSILITALTLSVGLLSMLAENDWVPIIAASASILIIMTGIAAICFALSKVNTGPAIAATVGISLLMIAVAAAFKVLETIDVSANTYNFISVLGSMIIVVGLAALLVVGLSKIPLKEIGVAALALTAMSGVFWAFSLAFKYLELVDINKVWPNLVGIGASISFLSLIMVGIGSMAKEAALGILALAGITGVFYAISKVAEIVAEVDTKGLVDNLTTLGIAIGILGVIISALGGGIVGSGGMFAVILLAGAAALLVFCGVMHAVAEVGNHFALVISNVAMGISLFAPAIQSLGEALNSFGSQDLSGVFDNLISAVETIVGLSLVSGNIGILAMNLNSLGTGLQMLSEYGSSVYDTTTKLGEAIPNFLTLIGQLKTAFSDLATELQNAIGLLSNDKLYGVITTLADAMKEHLQADFTSVGVIAMQYIIAGMQTEIAESVPPIINDVVNGLKAGAFDAEGELTALGARLGAALVEGFRGPDGIDAASPAKEFIRAMVDVVGGITTGSEDGKEGVGTAGANLGNALVEGFRGPDGIDAHSDSKKFLDAVGDCLSAIVNGVLNGKGTVESAFEWLGKKSVEAQKKGMMDNKGVVEKAVAAISDSCQDILDGHPIFQEIRTYLTDTTGLLDTNASTGPVYRLRDAKGRTTGYSSQKEINDARSEGRKKTREYIENYKKIQATTAATNAETAALGGNTGATKANSKAKKDNEEANEGKTSAIDEETESLEGEEEQTDETSEAIREMAAQIEVVTEKYHHLRDYLYTKGDFFKITKKSLKAMGTAFSNTFRTIDKDGKPILEEPIKRVKAAFADAAKSIPKTSNKIKKGLYAFVDDTEYSKKITKRLKKIKQTAKNIEKQVTKTGATIAKVGEGYAKIFYKSGNTVEKRIISLSKSVKDLGKRFKEAQNFAKQFENMNVSKFISEAQEYSDYLDKIRGIEKFEFKWGTTPQGEKNFLHSILDKFMPDFQRSMTLLSKRIDGVGDLFNKNNKDVAFVTDAYLGLASALYDGTDAANEYATQIAQLEFLAEHGEITWEEVEEAKIGYITRSLEALKEYYTQQEELLMGQFKVFEEFDQKLDDQEKDLIANIESQIAGFTQWSEMLMTLSERNLDFNLLKELKDQGVESFGLVKNMVKMTNEELALFQLRYQQSSVTVKEANDLATAALANARVLASARAASKDGKIAVKQMEQARKAAKRIADDNVAVARNQAVYNKLSKKEVKEYLKTLDEEQRKEYKNAYRKEKVRQKQLKKTAAVEEAKRKEEEYGKSLTENVKTFKDYLDVLSKYYRDSKALNTLASQLSKAFEELADIQKEVVYDYGTANEALLRFADTLDETGEEGLNYFEEMAARVKKFTEETKKAITDVNMLTTAFGKADKITASDIYNKNILSNIIGNSDIIDALDKIKNKGYSNYVLKHLKSIWDSDPSKARAMFDALISGNADYIKKVNAAYELQYEKAQAEANKWTGVLASGATKEDREKSIRAIRGEYEDRITERQNAEKRYNDLVNQINAKRNEQETIAREKADKKRIAEQIKNGGKLSKEQEKEYIRLLKKYGGSYNGKKYVVAQMAGTSIAEELANLNKDLEAASRDLTSAYDAENAAAIKLAQAEADLAKYNADLVTVMEEVAKDAKVKAWFDNNITSVKTMVDAMKQLNKESKEFKMVQGQIASIMENFTGAEAIYNLANNFASIKKIFSEKFPTHPINNITDGILRFGQSLVDAKDNAEDFAEALKEGLLEYQKTLQQSIRQSSDFFSMFKKFSDEDSPLTANDYLEYADSQIDALKTWQENLKKLADKGLDKEILEKFASQGLSSYEQVNAWVNATERQIGEYNAQWREYNSQIEKASNSAMASIGAAWSVAGQAMQEEMIKAFSRDGAERIANSIDTNTATKMIVTGIADGMTNAMPQIAQVSTKTGEVISSSIVQSVSSPTTITALTTGVTGAINKVSTSAEEQALANFQTAIDKINYLITEKLNANPVITPTIDETKFNEAIARMNAAIANVQANANNTAASVAQAQAATQTQNNNTTNNVTNVNFNQTNNSPKSLDQVEIYRNTQNFINQLGFAVDSNAATTKKKK